MMVVDPAKLLESLLREKRETEWLEFKLNRLNHEEVGRYISGLANAAMFEHKDRAYLVFGVDDKSHEVKGTSIDLKAEKVGNQIFEHWLSLLMHPRINFRFLSFVYESKQIEMIVIDPGYMSPVRFKNDAFIRVDSVQQLLRDFPQREKAIWLTTSRYCFEDAVAVGHLSAQEISEDFACDRLLAGLGGGKLKADAVADQLASEGLIIDNKQGGFDVTNLLVISASRDMGRFEALRFKAPRVIVYRETDKIKGKDETIGQLGYAISFTKLLSYIMDRVPHKERIEHGVRRKVYGLPEVAIREFLANALIHQDFTVSGSSPMIEIFSDRIKITNPGKPLINTDRFIDSPPKSRNEKLANLMRRMGLCESRGSGIDRALEAVEENSLPPPLIQVVEGHTTVIVYAQRSFAAMTKDERLRACYQHACLLWEGGRAMNNQSLRTRLGLSEKQYPQASIVIREALDENLIRPLDEGQGNRNARYLPWYAT